MGNPSERGEGAQASSTGHDAQAHGLANGNQQSAIMEGSVPRVPPMLDLFCLTFNAAKHFISPAVFAHHLRNALSENATSLPEVIVFSLQEMAPLASAFIGSYFLSPYFERFENALNLAAAGVVHADPRDKLYTLVATRNVGMTGIMLFALHPAAISDLKSAVVGFGAGDMANKGAVGLRMLYTKEENHTELTFVSAHLAAMEWHLEWRNKNYESIVSGLVFENPKQFVKDPRRQDPESEALLEPQRMSAKRALHDISIYKNGTHLFVAGDLNYRLSTTSPPLNAVFPENDPSSPNHYMNFLKRDQLDEERKNGRTLFGLSEAPITFAPTYKFNVHPVYVPAADEDPTREVDWSYAKHRWPSWCDRILYLDVPKWTQDRGVPAIRTTAYGGLPVVRTSDHRAVFWRAQVPVLDPVDMAVPEEYLDPSFEPPEDAAMDIMLNPRVTLPVPIDINTWEHRRKVARWEYLIGWSMVISKSKQGIIVFATVFAVAMGAWYYRSLMS